MTSIIEAIDDPRLFGGMFSTGSWMAWRAFLAALFGLPMGDEHLALYQRHTSRVAPPTKPARYAELAASLTEAQRALVRQAAAMIVQSEKLQGEVLRGEIVDCEQLTRLANAATRILTRLGVRKAAARAPTLREYLDAKAAQKAASGAAG